MTVGQRNDEPEDRPNIILVLSDQQQATMMGCAGHPALRTPAMDRLAAEGVRFTHAFCPTPQCSPSRASLLTGLYPHETQVLGNIPETSFGPSQLPKHLPNMASLLHESGYQTAYFGKWHLGAADRAESNPTAYGFQDYVPATLRSQTESEIGLADEVASYIASYEDRRPLLLLASFNDPHGVYALPKVTQPLDVSEVSLPRSFVDDLATKPEPQRVFRDEDQPAALPLDEETARRYLAWYAFMVERVDAYLDRILDGLNRRPDLEQNTIVIFSSDHGDLGCAHHLPFKGPCLYEELIRVPLLMRGPGIRRGIVRDELVTLADVLPTVCDLAGVAPPEGIDGRSLMPLLRDEAPVPAWRETVIAQYQGKQRWACPIRMIRSAFHKLTEYSTGERELYDLERDPDELVNLAGHPSMIATETTLAEGLDRWMDQHGDPFRTLSPTDRGGTALSD